MKTKKNSKVVLLIGSSDLHLNNAALIIEAGVDVKGICIAKRNIGKNSIQYLRTILKKYGAIKMIGQILERTNYIIFHRLKDLKIKKKLVNRDKVDQILKNWGGDIQYTENYNAPEIQRWIIEKHPDFILIQTPCFIGEKVRNIPKIGIIGGHPGITPDYRGMHSPFWALYNEEPNKIGYSVFWVDGGVDTGDVIQQGKIGYTCEDSYISISWKGMILIAKNMADIILRYSHGEEIPRRKHAHITESSNYGRPTFSNFIKYNRMRYKLRSRISA